MSDIFIASDNIITSLGFTTIENARNMLAGNTGIRLTEDKHIAPTPFYASLIDSEQLHSEFSLIDDPDLFSRFEQMSVCSIKDAISGTEIDCADPGTLFILSTTKGNIDLLENENKDRYGQERIYLWSAARLVQRIFNFRNEPVVISNACISGVQAIITGAHLIRAGLYDTVIINGTDIVSEFVLSGFNSFKSLSTGPCRPFDKTRDGLSLGEGSGTLILTSKPSLSKSKEKILVGEGFTANDANHISGPSRTGEGLFLAINRLLKRTPAEIDFISAHGTATLYNDDMEAIAITRAGLQSVPVNSFKGYWGHTLGAAGIIESVMSVYSLRNNVLINTLGYHEMGLTNPLAIIDKVTKKEITNCLKIASGFGGCNAAILFRKK
jgi:3-oxoacyl-[acyl-carrier-protein] synthase-1